MEIEKVVHKQASVGLKLATDGEFRRSWWHFDFLAKLTGCELFHPETGIQFAGVETRHELLRAVKYELGSAGRDLNFNAYADNRSIFRYDMEALPNEVTGSIGTSTAFAAWNAAVYVAQIEDDRLAEMTENSKTLEATREVLRKHNGLWFYDESYVISRRRD